MNEAELIVSWNLEVNSRERSLPGLNWWAQLMPNQKVSADVELAWAGIGTASLNRLTNAVEYRKP